MVKVPESLSKVRIETFANENSDFAILHGVEKMPLRSKQEEEEIALSIQNFIRDEMMFDDF